LASALGSLHPRAERVSSVLHAGKVIGNTTLSGDKLFNTFICRHVVRMATKLLKRGKGQPRHDWSNSGSFISRPVNGWLHPDEQLAPNAGICYGVRVCSACL